MNELVALRTKTSKSYQGEDGRITSVFNNYPIHYHKDGKWEETNPYLVSGKTAYTCDTAPIKVEIPKDIAGKFDITTSLGDKIGIKYLGGRGESISKSKNIVKSSLWTNASLNIINLGSSVKDIITLTEQGHPNSFSFDIDTDLDCKLSRGNIEFFKNKVFVGKLCRPFIEDVKNQKDRFCKVTQSGNRFTFTLPSLKELEYPIVIDPTYNEGQSTDDCDENAGTSIDLTSLNLHLGRSSSINWNNGLRFNNITIPQGSTINSAVISFKARYDQTNTTVDIDYWGDDVDDASTFSTYTDYDNRTKTTATTSQTFGAWTANSTYSSTELKTIVQEIVNRGSWSSGNSIAILTSRKTTWYVQQPYSYDYSSANAPYIVITHTPPAGGGGNMTLNTKFWGA